MADDKSTADDAALALLMLPLVVWTTGLKAVWRQQRNKSLEEMGLPPMIER